MSVKMRAIKRSPCLSRVFSIRRISIRSEPKPRIIFAPRSGRSPALAALVAWNGPPDHSICLRQTASRSYARFIHQPAHFLNRIGEPGEDRLADQKMSDIEFADMRNGGNRRDILISETVTGMDFQTHVGAKLRRILDMLEELGPHLATGIGKSASMQLHHRRTQRSGSIELLAVGLDEHGNPDARLGQRAHDRLQPREMTDDIDAAFGG